MALRFDGEVAIVTGAGAGLGRIYAHALAERGAQVVVNDIGAVNGKKSADIVVEEIKAKGGKAVANYDDVINGAKIVKAAVDAFQRVDIIVNNAGIIRDVGFQKMTDEQFDLVMKIHVWGPKNIIKAAWPLFVNQKHGRIINITSVNGLYGQRGQVNYSTAKSGVIGMSKALAKEGAKFNIKVNVVAPGAGSAMTATILPPNLVEAWKPDYVAPLVAFLAHKSVPVSGRVFEAGGGWFAEVKFTRSAGAFFNIDKPFSLDDVSKRFAEITDLKNPVDPEEEYNSGQPSPQLKQIMAKL